MDSIAPSRGFFGRTAAALVVALVAAMLPISSATAQTIGSPVAAVNVHQILSGSEGNFTFTVTNKHPLFAIRYVFIGPEVFEDFTAVGTVPVFGWDDELVGGGARFSTDGAGIAPNTSMAFTVVERSTAVSQEIVTRWAVDTAFQPDGEQLTADPAAAGALDTTTKLLRVDSVELTAPAEVLDGTLTAGQQATAEMTVTNASTASLLVTPGSTLGPSDAVTDMPDPATIAPGASAVFEYGLTAGSPGQRALTGRASAGDTDAIQGVSRPLVVEAAPQFSYKTDTFTPRSAPMATTRSFSLSLVKRNPPALDLDGAELTLTPQGGGAPLVTPATAVEDVPRGTNDMRLTFEPVTLPRSPSGVRTIYTPSVTLAGADENGQPLEANVAVGDTFSADRLLMSATPETSEQPVGTPKEIGVIVTDASGAAIGGVEVDMRVATGPNASVDLDGSSLSTPGWADECITRSNGTCTLSYTSSLAGRDHLVLWADDDSDETTDEVERGSDARDSAEVTWLTSAGPRPSPSPSPGSPSPSPGSPSPSPTPSPTETVGPGSQTISINASSGLLRFRRNLLLWGEIRDPSGCGGGPVTIIRTTPAGSLESFDASVDGRLWRLALRPRINADYQAILPETDGCAESASPLVEVEVRAKLRAHLVSSHPSADGCPRIRGAVTPGKSGQPIMLESRGGNRWVTLARATLSTQSTFVMRACLRSPGRHRLRVSWAGDSLNAPAKTRLSLRVGRRSR